MTQYSKYPQMNGVVCASAGRLWGWGLALLAGILLSLAVTFGGLQWVTTQIDAASDIKSSLITGILGLGLVLIGPVLLFAMAVFTPQWWLLSIKAHFRSRFLNTPHENRVIDP